jgi:hypothetical protein
MGRPYKRIFLLSVVITILLFGYDYTHDPGRYRLTLSQKMLEAVLYGAVYILLIFGVASALYFTFSKIVKRLKKP